MSKKVSILHIDESLKDRFTAEECLSQSNFSIVDSGSSIEEVFELCRNIKPDILLLDVLIELEKKQALLKRIKSDCQELKIAVAGSYCFEDCMEEYQEFGITNFIRKPFNKKGLVAGLNRVLKEEE